MPFSEILTPALGFTAEDPRLSIPKDAFITGASNLMYRGELELETVGGFERTTYGGIFNLGGDQSFIVGNGWAIVGDELNEGSGNVIEFIGRSIWFVGTGDVTVYMPGITAVPQKLNNSPLSNGIPQVAVLNPTKTGYMPPVAVGLLTQGQAPILQVPVVPGPGMSGIMTGTYSVVTTWIRDSTGAESLPSPPSNIVSLSNQSVIINFPICSLNCPTNTPLPRDKFRLYATPAGFGATGPYFLLRDIPYRRVEFEAGNGYAVTDGITGGTFNVFLRNPLVNGWFSDEQIGKRLVIYDGVGTPIHTANITTVVGNPFTINGVQYGDGVLFSPAYSGALSNTTHAWGIETGDVGTLPGYGAIEIEWSDNELQAIEPPVDYFPPSSTARFIAALGNVMVLIGTEDGNGVAVSVPNFPEAYPPNFRLNLPEVAIGVLGRPQDGFFYILCPNSIHEVRWTGAVEGSPVSIRTVAEQLGAAQQKAACQYANNIYTFTAAKNAARILSSGEVDIAFGNKMNNIFKTWNPDNVIVTFDEQKGYISYVHQDTILHYYPAYNVWTPPTLKNQILISGRPFGTLESSFTLNGIEHYSSFETKNINVSIAAGQNIVNRTSGDNFALSDVGKRISIPGAGAGPSTLVAFITQFNSPTQVLISIAATFTVGGVAAVVSGFEMWTWDRSMLNVDLMYPSFWTAKWPFHDYGKGLMPKTVSAVKAGMKSGVGGTYVVSFRDDYEDLTAMGTNRIVVLAAGNKITPIIDCNNGEAQLFSTQISGTGTRDKVFFLTVEGDESGIRL